MINVRGKYLHNVGQYINFDTLKQSNMIINKTPHEVNILNRRGQLIKKFYKGYRPIRIETKTVLEKVLNDGVPISFTIKREPKTMPEQKKNVYYIVSQVVKYTYPERDDFLVPSEIVRDEKGNIIGCMSLGR